MGERNTDTLAAWLILIGTLVFAVVSLAPPEVPGERAPDSAAALASGYDPARAFSTLEELASEPHPVGSDAHDVALAELQDWIRATGLEPELQYGLVRGRELTNVIVRLPGDDSTGTVLMSAHYDTVPKSPGAGDDGAGVVALLETLRVLAPLPRRNDLVLLFSDGEELGLLGAHLFARGSARGEPGDVAPPQAHKLALHFEGEAVERRPVAGSQGGEADQAAEAAASEGSAPEAEIMALLEERFAMALAPGGRRSGVPRELAALPSDLPSLGSALLDSGARAAALLAFTELATPTDRLTDVACVLNFEAIGNGGPVLMFETGPGSAGLVELWGQTSAHPVGNCLAAVIYGWMPNDTDLSVYRDRGVPGLNFAIAGGSGHYHSPADTPEAFDRAALAHMGATAVSLARRLVAADLDALVGDERTHAARAFVGLPPFGLFTWRGPWHLLLGGLALAGAAWFGRAQLAPRRLARALFEALGLALHVGAGAALLAVFTLLLVRPAMPLGYDGVELLLGVQVLGASLGALAWTRRGALRARANRRPSSLPTGAFLAWGGLFLGFGAIELSSPTSTGVSYAFALAAGGLALASLLRLRLCLPAWVAALAFVPALLTLGPILSQLVQLASRTQSISIVLASLLLALGMLLLAPLLVARD